MDETKPAKKRFAKISSLAQVITKKTSKLAILAESTLFGGF